MPIAHRLASRRFAHFVGLFTIGASTVFANEPVVDVGRLMGATSNASLRFYDANPSIMVSDVTVIFFPESDHGTRVEVTKAGEDAPVAGLAFFPDYQSTNAVFADVRPQGPGTLALPGAGDYTLHVKVAGEIATSFPFRVFEEGGDDPFNPSKKYHYRGPWETLIYLRESVSHTDKPVEVTFWTSALEVADGGKGELYVKLMKGGELLARNRRHKVVSKHTKLWGQLTLPLHEPVDHPNAPGFGFERLLASDGSYEIVIEIDGTPVRTYPFTVSDQTMSTSPRAELGYEPRADYLAPRTVDLQLLGQSNFVAREIYWLERAH